MLLQMLSVIFYGINSFCFQQIYRDPAEYILTDFTSKYFLQDLLCYHEIIR